MCLWNRFQQTLDRSRSVSLNRAQTLLEADSGKMIVAHGSRPTELAGHRGQPLFGLVFWRFFW